MQSDLSDEIKELLEEFKENRDKIKEMINDVEKLSSRISSMFPDKLEIRYARFFEEKVKSATELFRILLDMRQELSRSLKTEIDVRSKTNSDDNSSLDITEIARKVEKLQKKQEQNRVALHSVRKNEEKLKMKAKI